MRSVSRTSTIGNNFHSVASDLKNNILNLSKAVY